MSPEIDYLTLKAFREDSVLTNVWSKMGTDQDLGESTFINPLNLLRQKGFSTSPYSEAQAYTAYQQALIHRYITTLPDYAIQKGWKITFGDDDSKPEIGEKAISYQIGQKNKEKEEQIEEESIADWFYKAQIEANLGDGFKGGACLVLDIDDGRPPDQPVNLRNIRSIRNIYLFNTKEIEPYYDSYLSHRTPLVFYRLLYDPQFLDAFQRRYKKKFTFFVHRSRVLRFDGLKLPDKMSDDYYSGWGASILPMIMDEYKLYKSSLQAIAQIVQTANSFIYYMQGFQEMITSNNTENVKKLQKMLEEIKKGLSVWGGLLVDANNRADYLSRPFNGLDSVVQVLREDLIGVSKLPHTVLFGESPSGLGATGESEDNTLSAEVANFQRRHWYKQLKKYYKYVFLAKDGPTGGREPKNWDIEFVPIKQMTESDKANLTSLVIGILVQAVMAVDQLGNPLLTIEEARAILNEANLSGNITLNDELYQKFLKELKKQQAQQAGMGGMGMEGMGAEGMPSEWGEEAGGAQQAQQAQEAIAEHGQNGSQNGQAEEDSYNFEDFDFTQL